MDERARRAAGMRRFWDDRARENAAWYVDTSLAYDHPDMERFLETGRRIVAGALSDAPVRPEEHQLAVEIGPGLGRICAPLAEHFDRVIGIDVSAEMVGRARALVRDPRVEFMVGDGVGLAPVPDSSADFVTSFTVLQHLTSVELVLGYFVEAVRVLKPGGVLAMQWNNLPHSRVWRVQAAARRLRKRLGLGGDTYAQRLAPEFMGTRVSWRQVEQALSAVGASVQATQGRGTLYAWVWARKDRPPTP